MRALTYPHDNTAGSCIAGLTALPWNRSLMARIRCDAPRSPRSIVKSATSARFSSFSKRRHTTHEHPVEGRIYYRFHPRCGETVLIARRLEYRGVELVVIPQPDSSLACIPAWMTHEAAAQYALGDEPRFPLDILRSLRAETDALLGFLQSESKTEEAHNDVPIREPQPEPVRGGRAPRRAGSRTEGRSGDADGSPAARDRNSAGKRRSAMTKTTSEHLARI